MKGSAKVYSFSGCNKITGPPFLGGIRLSSVGYARSYVIWAAAISCEMPRT